MLGDIIWMTILMWIVATVSFAPLAYFIRKYTLKDKETTEN